MNARYQLRLAAMNDAAPIARISRSLIEFGLGWSWTPTRVASRIRTRESVVLVAEAAGHEGLVGFAIMDFGDEKAHLNLLGVRRGWQRIGVGRAMMQWLEASARIAGTHMIVLEVRESNLAAQRFYRSLGYQRLARLPGYYRGREHAIRMARDLSVIRRQSSE